MKKKTKDTGRVVATGRIVVPGTTQIIITETFGSGCELISSRKVWDWSAIRLSCHWYKKILNLTRLEIEKLRWFRMPHP